MNVIFDIDDYPVEKEKFFPKLKCTIFAIPELMTEETWKPLLERKEWIKVAIHGFKHNKGECRDLSISCDEYKNKIMKIIENPIHHWSTKMIKAPFHGYSPSFVEAARQLGLYVTFPNRKSLNVLFDRNFKEYYGGLLKIPIINGFVGDDLPRKDMLYLTGHTGVRDSIHRKSKRKFLYNYMSQANDFLFAEEVISPMFYKLNLGSGPVLLNEFENLDINKKLNEKIIKWEWNQNLNYPDNSCLFVLVQHALIHTEKTNYLANFKEIKRVLSPYGRLLIKDNNSKVYIWRTEGRYCRDGYIVRSNTNLEELTPVLNEAGLYVEDSDAISLINKYREVINRQRKMSRYYVAECYKKEEISI